VMSVGEDGTGTGALARSPHAARPSASPRAMAPAQNLVLDPTSKPYRSVIHPPTRMADRVFTFAAWV
jgi:hypothetical protein